MVIGFRADVNRLHSRWLLALKQMVIGLTADGNSFRADGNGF